MTLQMREKAGGDQRLYSPNRDIAHNFQHVVNECGRRLEVEKVWPEMQALLKQHDVAPDDLYDAWLKFANFVMDRQDDPERDMETCLLDSGFLDTKPVAQIALLAALGSVMAGYYWSGVRHATLGGEGPRDEMQWLRVAGRQAATLLAQPRWYRTLRRWGLRTVNFFRRRAY